MNYNQFIEYLRSCEYIQNLQNSPSYRVRFNIGQYNFDFDCGETSAYTNLGKEYPFDVDSKLTYSWLCYFIKSIIVHYQHQLQASDISGILAI